MAEAETADFEALGQEQPPPEAEEEKPENEDAAAAPETGGGPSRIARTLSWLNQWHPVLFLAAALGLGAFALMVYPKRNVEEAPAVDSFYSDGLDRLYRVLNPDLPLTMKNPADEAMAARTAFLNLFVFHRAVLDQYPQFINPHLLLGEANRLLAEFNPALAEKYYADAVAAYADAAVWENRELPPEQRALYAADNYLGGRKPADGQTPAAFLERNADEIAVRRERRQEYIAYRQAEANVYLNRPELARGPLEGMRRNIDASRREDLWQSVLGDPGEEHFPRHAFEIDQAGRRNLALLLARTYDGLGQPAQAKTWYLRYLASSPDGRNQAFVLERLADISMDEGMVYRRANPARAAESYEAAAGYFARLSQSPSADKRQREAAVMGMAEANARLADLTPEAAVTGVDELNQLGRTFKGWLEEFSGQPLPARTLELPLAGGNALASPELLLPGFTALPGEAGGSLVAMAGGGVTTPFEQRRRFLLAALENYDRAAAIWSGTPAGVRAAVLAARECWRLGLKSEAEARFEKMLDPLSSQAMILAARLGLARAALDRNDLARATLLILGGYAHPLPLWFTPADADWRRIAARLGNPANRETPNVWRRIWEVLPEEGREIASYAASGRRLDDEYVDRFLRAMNAILRNRDFYQPGVFPEESRNVYLNYLLARPPELMTAPDVAWRNRLLLEAAWPYDLAQRASRDVVGFTPFPPGRELEPGGLTSPEQVRDILLPLGQGWAASAAGQTLPEQARRLLESIAAYQAALDRYGASPGETHYELARDYEALAAVRDAQGNHTAALALLATAGRNYLAVSLRDRGTPRELDALLAAGDAFFQAGLLERTVESQQRLLERFGYAARPGGETAMAAVRAENLLGRALWFLNDTPQAIESFKRNIPRRTPDRYKSIYYIGRVLMDEGIAMNKPELLGNPADPLPPLDRNNDPVIANALQAFTFIRQSPDIDPAARAWRWSSFDLAKLKYRFAEQARQAGEQAAREAAANAANAAAAANPAANAAAPADKPWLRQYEEARDAFVEVLERYQLRRNGGSGLSVRVEPADFADVMISRFETEYLLAATLLILSEGKPDSPTAALARAHLENLQDRNRYSAALFDPSLDRFQLNAAVIRDELGDTGARLERSRLGDDEGPAYSPEQLRAMLRNGMLLLANEYFRAGETASGRGNGTTRGTPATPPPAGPPASGAAASFYRRSYDAYRGVYDQFGPEYGVQAMVGMGDALSRLGSRDEATNHYHTAVNLAGLTPADSRFGGVLDIGPAFWGRVAENRLQDLAGGYATP